MDAPPPIQSTLAESQQKSVHKQTVKSGRGYILAVGILQLVACGLFFAMGQGPNLLEEEKQGMLTTAIAFLIIGLVYIGLWVWAKSAPFAAALVALILYVSLLALDAAVSPETIARGIIVKILIIAGLCKAVQSGHALKKAAEAS